jgi:hypothetical protein
MCICSGLWAADVYSDQSVVQPKIIGVECDSFVTDAKLKENPGVTSGADGRRCQFRPLERMTG